MHQIPASSLCFTLQIIKLGKKSFIIRVTEIVVGMMMSDKMALMKISFDKIKLTIGSFATQYDQVGSYYYYTSENILF